MNWSERLYATGRKREALWLSRNAALSTIRPGPIATPDARCGKTIVICCDGTANDPKQTDNEVAAQTNVYRLYEALTEDGQFAGTQITWYDPGIGTNTSTASRIADWIGRIFGKMLGILPDWIGEFIKRLQKALESATGVWIDENIEQGYREIVRNYEPGDRIFIFGFSRGAYTARCIAGMISRCGLLKAENIRFSPDALTLFRRRNRDVPPPILKAELIHDPEVVRVHVLGLWDTVASLGLPLWGWWFRVGAFWRNRDLDSNPAKLCDYVYHALSMDEQRSQFFPTVTTPDPAIARQQIRQIWLRGAHADVGGGYGNRSLAAVGFECMLQIARHHGLKLRRDIDEIGFHPQNGLPLCAAADPLGKMHDEIKSQPAWIIFGSWPRWAPVPRPGWSDLFQRGSVSIFGAPHDLVYRRAEQAALLWRQRLPARIAEQQRAAASLTATQAARAATLTAAAAAAVQQNDSVLARDGLIFLGLGQSRQMRITAAVAWNRTAIVFETTGIYRIGYLRGNWRDSGKTPCGADGQRPRGLDWARRFFWRSRRLSQANWLELIGHIAHPRPWPVEEFGFGKLLRMLFFQGPKPLTRSLLRLGRHLPAPDQSVYVVNLADNGLFYAFANDTWATGRDNSGSIEIEIERVVEVPAAAPAYAVTPRGEAIEWQEVPLALRSKIEERNAVLAATLGAAAAAGWPDLRASPPMLPPDVPDDAEPPKWLRGNRFPELAVAFTEAARDDGGTATIDDDYLAPPEVTALDRQIRNLLEGQAERPVISMAERLQQATLDMLATIDLKQIIFTKGLGRPPRARTGGIRIPRRARPHQAARTAWSADWDRDEV